MSACYPDSPIEGSPKVPGCDGHLVAEDPTRLQGPDLGFVLYEDKYAHATYPVRVIERSYVWAPEQHYTGQDGHGNRHYDWSVIERGPGKYRSIVVNDTDLSPLPKGARIIYGLVLV